MALWQSRLSEQIEVLLQPTLWELGVSSGLQQLRDASLYSNSVWEDARMPSPKRSISISLPPARRRRRRIGLRRHCSQIHYTLILCFSAPACFIAPTHSLLPSLIVWLKPQAFWPHNQCMLIHVRIYLLTFPNNTRL